ncbi:MAG: hypothetical protein JKY57_05120 [Kordiimonadaceae bacterium]|nr:hypothetical protein [Kordiimonadaceae bacterium]
MIEQVTANLAVETIEPSAEFLEKIGFSVAMRVPEDGAMGFAILVHGSQQVMFQTRESLKEDGEAFGAASDVAPVMLYVTVPDVKAVAEKLEGYEVALDWRETFYGATEISFKEPGGHLVTFAEFPYGVK